MLPVFNRTLSVGISGYDVYVMQRILAKAGFLTAEPTGYFGPATKTALMEYQNSKSLEMVGYVGPSTRAALSQELQGLPVLSGE
jgi:peptidoglycan hydrolase-like protein with peptidoglycan-binding domain